VSGLIASTGHSGSQTPQSMHFIGVNDEHVLALIEAVHRTHLDTVHVLAANAALIDDVGQLSLLAAECITPGTRPLFSGPLLSLRRFGEGVRRVTCVAASVQSAHIHHRGRWSFSFDL
jgi:hypothetical protein